MTRTHVLAVSFLFALGAIAQPYDPARFKAMEWREVGPFRGGRVAAVEGIASQPNTYYFGSVGGGVWKTTDGGETWKNVSDGFFGGSIGAVAVSEWDPNVVYAGGGEVTVRGNVSHGDGMWKSTDAGKSWTNVGLKDARQIPRIRIHPRDPDIVYVAVLGHLFGPSKERGVYRTKDGGKTWERILYINENAGAVDLALDPTNPRIVYASTWRVRRTPYSLESGGEGSGLWKSTDGGDTWKSLSKQQRDAEGNARHHRRHRLGVESTERLRDRRSGRGRRLPFARRRRDVGEDEREPRSPPARLVLLADLRRSERRRHGLRRQRPLSQIEGRRQDVLDASPLRTATITISGSRRTIRSA